MPAEGQSAPVVSQIEIKVNGTSLSNDIMDTLFEVEVESTLHLPSMFTMRFHDEKLSLVDGTTFPMGGAVVINVATQAPNQTTQTLTKIMDGEITAIEPDFSDGFMATLTIRGYDKGHRLLRGTKTKAFVQAKDSDIVSQIASGAGLQAVTDVTTVVHEHVFQYNISDWAFVHERARRNGYEVWVEAGKLNFKKPATTRTEVPLQWGETLRSFRPHMTLAKQVEKVTVKGWNPKQKQAIVGVASTSSVAPQVGIGNWGGPLAQAAFSAAQALEVRRPVKTQGEATAIAQSLLDESNASFLEAEGIAFGTPTIKAGVLVNLTKLGTKFSGMYMVTMARHIYNPEAGYDTHFVVQGARAQTVADLVDGDDHTSLWGGIVVGLVTNVNDPDGMGRVKVKFPWLDDTLESNWARLSGIGAGANRGIFWLPEVNDEVLVAFEHGNFDSPYVVGAVWNGTDKPPEAMSDAVKSGKTEVRTFKTRLGHIIRLTDDASKKTIEIIGASNKTSIKLDEVNSKITITSQGDIELAATQKLTLKGAQVAIEGQSQVNVKSSGTGALEASGPLTVKGAVVNIN